MHKNSKTTLVIGGCRSGKSRIALEAAEEYEAGKRYFIATARAFDEEMEKRIARHRAERPAHWRTVEAQTDLPEKLDEVMEPDAVVLVDCLTLWVTNLLLENPSEDAFRAGVKDLTGVLNRAKVPVILVTNEVGCSVVPENPLARQFRDLAGETNQAVAKAVDRVILAMAGIPVVIKGKCMG